ncbi:MAG TPA: winged helix-turn-helix domain-containing protein [Conexibacter sp.]|nr:winged helix-turn-helix domain-containing protein [Conexibacter sp.]
MPELLLPRLKHEIEARLAELRPIVAEAERLEAAKEALLAEAAAVEATARRARAPRASNGFRAELRNGAASNPLGMVASAHAHNGAATGNDDERAPRGANQTAILAIVEERPGVSVAEIAAVTKIAKPTVASTISKLKRDGVLADEAGGVKLASRQPVTLSQIAAPPTPTRADGVSDEEWEAARRDHAAA